jgi:hypothetical protein
VSPSNSKGHDIVLSSRDASRLKVWYCRYTQHRVLLPSKRLSTSLNSNLVLLSRKRELRHSEKNTLWNKTVCNIKKQTNKQSWITSRTGKKQFHLCGSWDYRCILSEKGRGEGGWNMYVLSRLRREHRLTHFSVVCILAYFICFDSCSFVSIFARWSFLSPFCQLWEKSAIL